MVNISDFQGFEMRSTRTYFRNYKPSTVTQFVWVPCDPGWTSELAVCALKRGVGREGCCSFLQFDVNKLIDQIPCEQSRFDPRSSFPTYLRKIEANLLAGYGP